MADIVDSYSESNQGADWNVGDVDDGADGGAVGQSFTGNGQALDSVKFYLKKTGSPTGNATAKIYAHSGVFGDESIPTGGALATSANFDVSTLTTSYQLITFTFSGGDRITLTNATKYIVVLDFINGGSVGNLIVAGIDSSSPTHDGNFSSYDEDAWGFADTVDLVFYVYGETEESTNDANALFQGSVF